MRVVVVGTGTEIGKTEVGVGLLRHWAAAGRVVAGLKPVESGCEPVAHDAERLGEAAGAVHQPLFALRDPVSPHLAARREAVGIDLALVGAWCEQRVEEYTLVETAGGLMSPLGPGVRNLELAKRLLPDVVVLVGVERLGALHDMAVCMAVLEGAGLGSVTIGVLVSTADADAALGTNLHELRTLGIVPRVCAVRWGLPVDVSEVAVLIG